MTKTSRNPSDGILYYNTRCSWELPVCGWYFMGKSNVEWKTDTSQGLKKKKTDNI